MTRRKRGSIAIFMGVLLVLGAIGLSYYNMQESLEAGHAAETTLAELRLAEGAPEMPETSETPAEGEDPEAYGKLPRRTVAGVGYCGVLSLPALGIELPVAEGWSYPNLKKAPCLYTGSPYGGNMVICAHNYPRHFGSIGNMPIGSPVVFTDMTGQAFDYTVASVEILDPYAYEAMVYSDYDLTLFTCTLGGRTRVTVRCNKYTASGLQQPGDEWMQASIPAATR